MPYFKTAEPGGLKRRNDDFEEKRTDVVERDKRGGVTETEKMN